MSGKADSGGALESAALPGSADRVVLEILIHGPLSRVELARRLGLSGPSLTRLTKPLIASGRLIERTPQARELGRPQQPLDLDPKTEHCAGVKITADALYTVITDLRGSVRAESQEKLATHEPAEVASAIVRQVRLLAAPFAPLSAIGISLGGRTSDGRTINESNILEWDDVPLADLVEQDSGVPTVVANDVNALTQAQHWFGAGRELTSFVVVTIGAGIGMGVVAGGELAAGLHGAAGSIGHQVLTHSDAMCWRGHRGCASALLSTRAVERAASDAGRPAGYDDILRGAERGDPILRRVVDVAGDALGILLASVANAFDPQKIVLAGEGARLGEVGEHAMLSAVRANQAWRSATTPIDVQPFAFNEWARGAAATAIQARMLRG